MKLTIYTYYLYLALLCTPVLFGAATSGSTSSEQYQQALQQGNINAIVAAYAELPQEMRRAPEIYAPLVRALLADKPTDEATIAILQNIFINAQHPVLKWVLRNDRTELDQRLNQLEPAQTTLRDDQENGQAPETMATLEERYQAAQQEQMAPASSSEQISLSDDRELKRTKRTGFLATLEQSAKRQQLGKDIPTVHEFALRSITKDIITKNPITAAHPHETQLPIPSQLAITTIYSADDLRTFIASVISPEQLKTLNDFGIYEAIFNRLANILANDYFLKSKAKRDKLKAKMYPEYLPEWLREHFTGVSIQDLIDYGTDFKLQRNPQEEPHRASLFLDEMYINDLAGLENIPGIKDLTSLTLRGNQIPIIEDNAFASLPNLEQLTMSNNGIAVIKPYAFNGLSKLTQLHLGNDQVTIIEQDALVGLSNLVWLDLTGNQISIVKPHAFANLNTLKLLQLTGNPIAQNLEERVRIEEEVNIATNGQGRIEWGVP